MTEQKAVWVGRLIKPRGVGGELKLRPAEGSSGAWRKARRARLGGGKAPSDWRELEGVRGSGPLFIVKLKGIDSPEEARRFCGADFYVPRGELAPPAAGECYLADLMGVEVTDRAGRRLGRLADSFSNGAHEVYVIRQGRREMLLPAIEGVVLEIDLERGRMVVDPPEGLWEP